MTELTGIELIKAIKVQITAHPELFNMSVWSEQRTCGTTGCIAGWACMLNGAYHAEDEWGDSILVRRNGDTVEEVNPEEAGAWLIFGDGAWNSIGFLFSTSEQKAKAWIDDCIAADEVIPFRSSAYLDA